MERGIFWHSINGVIRTNAPDFGLMGIINLAPDSFFDGGSNSTPEAALQKTSELLAIGADIIDVGAESTRPGASAVPPELETGRLAPFIELVLASFPEAIISVDTRNATSAQKSLELGAHIINDVSGLQYDPGLLEVLATFKPGYVLTHSQGLPESMQLRPCYENVIDEICAFFEKGLNNLEKAGLPGNRIVLDPGIGFGKSLAHNLEIIRGLDKFLAFGHQLLIGLSMKSLFGDLLGHGLHERACDTAVSSALCWEKGVFWHRAHKVKEVRDALAISSAFAASTQEVMAP